MCTPGVILNDSRSHPIDIYLDGYGVPRCFNRTVNEPSLARPLSGMLHEVIDMRSPRLRIITPGGFNGVELELS